MLIRIDRENYDRVRPQLCPDLLDLDEEIRTITKEQGGSTSKQMAEAVLKLHNAEGSGKELAKATHHLEALALYRGGIGCEAGGGKYTEPLTPSPRNSQTARSFSPRKESRVRLGLGQFGQGRFFLVPLYR